MTTEDKAKCGHPLYWYGCYRGSYDLVAPDSMAHPAKMSPSLCYRILQHLEELGLLKQGDKILDPMAGTGITNICAGAMGYPSISVELEEKFVGFQKQNKEYAERRLYKPLDWTMVQGDSRRLGELLQGKIFKTVTSPPFGDMNHPTNYLGIQKRESCSEYSDNPDNIGNLKDVPLKSITSPPYEQSITGGKSGIEWQEEWGKPSESRQPSQDISYGGSKENIGNLKDKPLKSIVSPPYGEALSGGGIAQYGHYSDPDLAKRIYSAEHANPEERSNIEKQIERVKQGRAKMKRPDVFTSEGNKAAKGYFEGNYSRDPENIGNLKDTPLKSIVSPPYGETGIGDWKTGRAEFQAWVINELKTKGYVEWQGKRYNEAEWRAINHGRIDGRTTKGVHKHPTDGYSDNPDNIGGLPDKPLKSVMSPPYEDAKGDKHHSPRADVLSEEKSLHETYTERGVENVGNEKGESYLEAMAKVYREISLVSDVLCVVVKNPTRNGKLRRLDLDTVSILEASGWRIYCQHRALLFEELEQADMFEGSKKQVKGRLSFFKRLSWLNGQPVASWEDVIFATRKSG